MAKSVNPDHMPHSAASDLSLLSGTLKACLSQYLGLLWYVLLCLVHKKYIDLLLCEMLLSDTDVQIKDIFMS